VFTGGTSLLPVSLAVKVFDCCCANAVGAPLVSVAALKAATAKVNTMAMTCIVDNFVESLTSAKKNIFYKNLL
jgi:hypothetical protein